MWLVLAVAVTLMTSKAVLSAPFPIKIVVMGDKSATSLVFDYKRSMPAVNMAEELVRDLYQ